MSNTRVITVAFHSMNGLAHSMDATKQLVSDESPLSKNMTISVTAARYKAGCTKCVCWVRDCVFTLPMWAMRSFCYLAVQITDHKSDPSKLQEID